MTLGERIKLIRGDLSQKDFGDLFEISRDTLRRYETGSNPPTTDFILAVCEKFHLNPTWLLTGKGRPKDGETTENIREEIYEKSEEYDYIPMAKATLSAGGGNFVLSEDISGYYAFRKSWVHAISSNKKNLVLMKVTGDSMHATIQNGDTVMIDTGRQKPKEGGIFALRADDTVMIKRISFRPENKVLIISDNKSEYPAYEADINNLHILGQVIFFSRVLIHE